MELERIKETLRGQLQAELTLGGRWLPRGDAHVKGAEMGKKKRTLAEKKTALLAIAERVEQCRACPLGSMRLHVVPGAGHPDARLVFVGEAPGETEDQQGLPFVGRAGVLLTKIIEAMGLRREEVFICNILKCRPPENRDPLLSEVEACSGYLHEQLKIIEPEIIVALGSHAAKTLLETTTSIGELRGKVHAYVPGPLAEPIPLVATYHPAYLLRNYTDETRRRVWQDMQRVLQFLNLPIPAKK